jgi:hypothetical protein
MPGLPCTICLTPTATSTGKDQTGFETPQYPVVQGPIAAPPSQSSSFIRVALLQSDPGAHERASPQDVATAAVALSAGGEEDIAGVAWVHPLLEAAPAWVAGTPQVTLTGTVPPLMFHTL